MKPARPNIMTESVWAATARPPLFWFAALAIVLASALSYRDPGVSDLAGFLLIVVTALLPAYLWSYRFAYGIPIYPIFTGGTIWTFALPLISHHPLVVEYPAAERLVAAGTIAAVNLVGTLPWYLLTRCPPARKSSHYGFRRGFGDAFFFAILIATILFDLAQGRLAEALDPAIVSILRAIVIALSNLAIFLLAYKLGRGDFSPGRRIFCAILFVLVMLSTLPSALMVGALSYAFLALVGMALGRGRVPWISLGILTAAALFLQGGKEDLRNKYWYSTNAEPASINQYPEMLTDWIRFSFDRLLENPTPKQVASETNPESFAERASLLQLFLRIQKMSPAEVPYLHGATYSIIPRLLIPRAFNEQKERAHLGTYILSVHYELQTTEDTYTTTIGFGLLNEAMANFGYPGCLALGAALGIFYGGAARWSACYPLLSLRTLFAVLVLTVSFQNEFSAGIYASTLFQGSCALVFLALLTMGRVSTLPRTSPSVRYPIQRREAHA
jgi:hypothetical protein